MIDHLHTFLALLLSSLQDVLKISCPQVRLWLRVSPLLLFSSSQSNWNPSAQKLRPSVALLGQFPISALSSVQRSLVKRFFPPRQPHQHPVL